MSYRSSLKQSVYYALPYPLKCGVATLYGAQQRRVRYGSTFRQTVDELQTSQYWDPATITAYEEATLGRFLTRVYEHTPYYRDAPGYHSCQTRGDLADLPILDKGTVQQQMLSFYADDFKSLPHQWGHTSGTTGRALVFPISQACFQREYAFRALHYSWGGIDLLGREPVAFCSGHPVAYHDRNSPPYWTWDAANNWLLLSSYHLSSATVKEYVRKLESFQPKMLGGYPSSLYILALAMKRYGRDSLDLQAVFTASEMLFDFQRETIEEAFGANVFNWYGNSEMCGHITECEERRLHTRYEHSVVEVLGPNGDPCGPGETGAVVATGFHNAAFPLIRYRVGDQVTVAREQVCPCGRGGLVIDRIEGRDEDYVVTPEGRLVGRLDHLFKESVHVEEAQIQQDHQHEVIVRIVRKPGYGPTDEQALVEQGRQRLGSSMGIVFDYVDHIPRTPSGKFRFVLSSINTEKWLREVAGP